MEAAILIGIIWSLVFGISAICGRRSRIAMEENWNSIAEGR